MDLRALIARRTVRAFTPTAVPDDVLREIVGTASWTGSARNRQPWRFVAVRDPKTRSALAQLGAYAGHLADAPTVLVVLSPSVRALDTEFDVGRITQSITLACGRLDLGSCVVSLYPETNAAAAAAIVGADPTWAARHAIAIGHPAPCGVGRLAIPRGRLGVDDLLTVHRAPSDVDA